VKKGSKPRRANFVNGNESEKRKTPENAKKRPLFCF